MEKKLGPLVTVAFMHWLNSQEDMLYVLLATALSKIQPLPTIRLQNPSLELNWINVGCETNKKKESWNSFNCLLLLQPKKTDKVH